MPLRGSPPPRPPAPHAGRSPASGRIGIFATDLDRTLLAAGGSPTEAGREALRTVQGLGLRALLVSGRRLDELRRYARAFGRFDGLVGENGAVVEVPVGAPPVVLGRRVAGAVHRRLEGAWGSEGEFGLVVASFPRHRSARLARLLAPLPVRLVANVDRVMVLPEGISKHTGVVRALARMGRSRSSYSAIGDGENDVEMLRYAALSGAVANATLGVRRVADYVSRGTGANGVLEFVAGPLARAVRT